MLRLLLLLLIFSVFSGCLPADSVLEEEQKKTESSMQSMLTAVGMPAIKNYHEKRMAKMLFELRDQADLVTYAYIVAKNTGKLVFIGECVGYGLPYSIQYTSPSKISYRSGGASHVVPQADPNGLYMPDGLSATWLMMRDSKSGEIKPVYVEPEIIVSPFKLDVN